MPLRKPSRTNEQVVTRKWDWCVGAPTEEYAREMYWETREHIIDGAQFEFTHMWNIDELSTIGSGESALCWMGIEASVSLCWDIDLTAGTKHRVTEIQ